MSRSSCLMLASGVAVPPAYRASILWDNSFAATIMAAKRLRRFKSVDLGGMAINRATFLTGLSPLFVRANLANEPRPDF